MRPEGISGAIAVAAAVAAASRGEPAPDPLSFLELAASAVPGPVGEGVAQAASLAPGMPA